LPGDRLQADDDLVPLIDQDVREVKRGHPTVEDV